MKWRFYIEIKSTEIFSLFNALDHSSFRTVQRSGGKFMNILETNKPVRIVAYMLSAVLLITTHTTIQISVEASATKNEKAKTKLSVMSETLTTHPDDAWLEVIVEEINKKKNEVENYVPSESNRAFVITTPYWLLFAVSPKARMGYYKQVNANEFRRTTLDAAFNSLFDSVAKKLSFYKPETELFSVRNPPGEQMILGSLKNSSTLKVHKIGFKEVNWLIEKNTLGIPLNRYKHGYIWARDTADDHPYCHLYMVYLQQNYASGGRYGQTFTNVLDDQIVGCP